MSKDTAAIRDQLGNDPEIIPILNADYWEEIGIEEGPTKITSKGLGNTWIVGTSTNAIVGEWTGTNSGGQLIVGVEGFILGSATLGVLGENILGEVARNEVIVRVVNPNNRFIERFAFEYMIDEDGTNGVTINTTTQEATFSAGDLFTMTFPFRLA